MATPPAADYDSPWKEALVPYFQDFLRLLAPWLHERIDWSHPPVFLDKELQAITRGERHGRLYADKLVRVVSKNQRPFYILVHIEIQGERMGKARLAAFGRRMFRYAWRIEDHYSGGMAGPDGAQEQVELVSLAVLTASRGGGTHLNYSWGRLDANSGQFRFRVVHLASWLGRWQTLEEQAARNPFAAIVMAQLQAQATSKSGPQRLVSKTRIIQLLYQYRYSRQDVLALFRIIDWMMALPAELEPAFEQAIITIEQEHKMAFVTSIERLGEKRGWEKGRKEGRNEGQITLLQRLLTRKFGPLPESVQQCIQGATPAQIETWSLNILDAQTLEGVFTPDASEFAATSSKTPLQNG